MDLALGERIIVLVDMDCFYVQVEQNEAPEYLNKPCTVVQYNPWKGGGIIAVNYEARAFGVKRGLRGDDAKRLCPEVHNFCVPEVRGKADLTKYREAGAKVLEVLCEFSDCVERASIDEAFLDLTTTVNEKIGTTSSVFPNLLVNTFVVGWDNESKDADVQGWLDSIYEENHALLDQKLAVAAIIVEEMRAAVYSKTKYRCSAGISHNKMLAKLACGLHKPNKQTILPHSSVPILYKTLPIRKIRNLGGKLGEEVKEKLGAEMMSDLAKFTKIQLCDKFGEKTGYWLYLVANGIEHDSVVARQLPKSIGCGKNFRGKEALDTKEKVHHWVKELASELEDRLKKDLTNNRRIAKTLTVTVRSSNSSNFNNSNMVTRACALHIYSVEKFINDVSRLIQKLNVAPASSPLWQPPVINLALTASKFEDRLDSSSCNISSYFKSSPVKSAPDEESSSDHQSSNNNASTEFCSDNKDNVTNYVNTNVKNKKANSNVHSSNFKTKKTSKELSKKPINSYFLNPKILNSSSETPDIDSKDQGNCSSEIKSQTRSFVLVSSSENAGETYIESEDKSTNQLHELGSECESESVFQKTSFFTKKLKEKKVETCEKAQGKNITKENDDNLNKKTEESKIDLPIPENESSTNIMIGGIIPNTMENHADNRIRDAFQIDNSSDSCAVPECSGGMQTESELNEIQQKLSDEVTFLCKKCSHRIPVWEEQEHQDYHMALNLHAASEIEHNKPPITLVKSDTNGILKSSAKKRNLSKVSSTRTQKKQKQQTNTLDSFIKGT